jgi:8-oxo-dGTP pyrophosphatase MutT (NUDIX family)
MTANPSANPSIAAIDGAVIRVERLEFDYAPQPWSFADARRQEIDAHFADGQRKKPALWNGRVLLLHRHRFEGLVFKGAFLETDFASFYAWRNWGFPEAGVVNCFAMAALCGSDGGYLLGVMGAHTASAGMVYFPAGTPEPEDIVGDKVDLTAGVMRELTEETGLTSADVTADAGWYSVLNGPRIAHMKVLRAPEPAAQLRARIVDHLAGDPEPELSDIMVVREPADLDARVPPFVTAFLLHVWKGEVR